MCDAVQIGGKTIAQLGEGLVTVCGLKSSDLIPELRTSDDWKTATFWFTLRGAEAGEVIYLGRVEDQFATMDDVRAQWAEWVASPSYTQPN